MRKEQNDYKKKSTNTVKHSPIVKQSFKVLEQQVFILIQKMVNRVPRNEDQ